MTRMIVVCAGDALTRFDRDYYATKHVALTMQCWDKHGLLAVETFFPSGEGDGWLSIGVYRFRDCAGMDAALASPETDRIMADVKNFTDTKDITRSIFDPMR